MPSANPPSASLFIIDSILTKSNEAMMFEATRRSAIAATSLAALLICQSAVAFAPLAHPAAAFSTAGRSTFALSAEADAAEGTKEKVLLVGPSLLQLVVTKALKARGYDVLLVCPTDKKDKFGEYIQNGLDEDADAAAADVISRSLFGLPEESDPEGFGWREGITSVVVCAEDPIIGSGVIDTVCKWDGFGNDRDTPVDGPSRAILLAPITNRVNKEKPPGWVPIFNNDKKEAQVWETLVEDWSANAFISGERGNCDASIMRFGSLFGGGVDGPEELKALGLNERTYKMSLEQYRDLRERAFDRNRLGGQVLIGDAINIKPSDQDGKEKRSLKGEEKEAYQTRGGYPEQDRTCRHTLAQAVCEALSRPVRDVSASTTDDGSVPAECTILSTAEQSLPTGEEWAEMFANPGPATWPDPAKFVMPVVEKTA